ncbi:MAG: hypothetical protein U0X91_12210 [Spirosomataceae bacterium]
MKKYWSTCLLYSLFIQLITLPSHAQPVSRLTSSYEIGVGWNDKAVLINGQYHQYLKIDRRGFLQVGWGLGASHLRGRELDFTTAPAQLTKGKTGFAALNAPTLLRQIDTLQMKTGITSFNFAISAQLSLFERVDLGANVDLLGFALGARRAGLYLSSKGYNKVDSLNLHRTYQQARPARFNFLLLGDNTRGNLNTELYARIHIVPQVSLKISYLFTTGEYRTEQLLTDDNRRFRYRSPLLFVGLTFPID